MNPPVLLALVLSAFLSSTTDPSVARASAAPPVPALHALKASADQIQTHLQDATTKANALRLDVADHERGANVFLRRGREAIRARHAPAAQRNLVRAQECVDAIITLVHETDVDPRTMDPKVLAAAKQGKRLRLTQVRDAWVEQTQTARRLRVEAEVHDLVEKIRDLLTRAGETITVGRIARAEILLADASDGVDELSRRVMALGTRTERLRLEQVRNELIERTRTARELGVKVGDLDAHIRHLLVRAGENITLGRFARADELLDGAAGYLQEVARRVQVARESGSVIASDGGKDGILTIAEVTQIYHASSEADAFMERVHARVFPPKKRDDRGFVIKGPPDTPFQTFVQKLYDEHFGEPYVHRGRDWEQVRRRGAKRWNKETLYRRLVESIDPRRYEGLVKNNLDKSPVRWSASVGDDVLWLNGHHPVVSFAGNTGNDRVLVHRPSTVDEAKVVFGAGQDRFDFQGTLKNAFIDGGPEPDRFRVVGNTQASLFAGRDGNDSMAFAGTVQSSRVSGGEGHDRILLLGVSHRSIIDAGEGNDIIVVAGDAHDLTVDLGEGNDTLSFSETFRGNVNVVDGRHAYMTWQGRWLRNHDVIELDGQGWAKAGGGYFYRRVNGRVVASIKLGDHRGHDDDIEVVRALPHQLLLEREPDVGKPSFGVVLGRLLGSVAFAWVPGPGGMIISSTWAIMRSDGDPFAIASGVLGVAAGAAVATEASQAARTFSALSSGAAIAGRFADGDVSVSDVLSGLGFAVQQSNRGQVNDAVRALSAARAVAGMAERGMVDPLGLFEVVDNVIGIAADDERKLELDQKHLKAKDLDEIYLALGAELGILTPVSYRGPLTSGNWTYHSSTPRSFQSTAALQNRLRVLGYYDGPVDGSWNAQLDEAIRDFHIANLTAPAGSTSVGSGTARRLFDDARSYSAHHPIALARLAGRTTGIDYDRLTTQQRAQRWRGIRNHLLGAEDLGGSNGLGAATSTGVRPVAGVPITVSTTVRNYGGQETGRSVSVMMTGVGGRVDRPGSEATAQVGVHLSLKEALTAIGGALTLVGQPQFGGPVMQIAQGMPVDIGVQGSVSLNYGFTERNVQYVRINVSRGVTGQVGPSSGSRNGVRSWQIVIDNLEAHLPDEW